MSRDHGVSRWMTWQPPISRKDSEPEATKPSKPSFEGFDGSVPGDSQKIHASSVTPDGFSEDLVSRAERPLEPEEPWTKRDEMLHEGGGAANGISPAQSKTTDAPQDAFFVSSDDSFVGFDGPHQGQLPKMAGSKTSKLPHVTNFEQSFFDELAQIPAETLSELRAKARGKPRECIEAYWRSKHANQECSGE